MATNNSNCLESKAITERSEETAKNSFRSGVEYSTEYAEQYGKGTGHGGHMHSLPDCTIDKTDFDVNGANFDIWDGGNDCDKSIREQMLARQKYGPDNEYNTNIDMSGNEGQYEIGQTTPRWICPVL